MCITNCLKIFSFQFASFCDSYYIYTFSETNRNRVLKMEAYFRPETETKTKLLRCFWLKIKMKTKPIYRMQMKYM